MIVASLGAAAAPLLTLVLVVAADAWVYVDARAHAEAGDPVTVSIGSARVDTQLAWLVCCVVLFIVAFPMYLVARRAARRP